MKITLEFSDGEYVLFADIMAQVALKRQKLAEEKADRVIELYGREFTIYQITQETGLTKGQVSDIIEASKLP